ncbi:MAG: ABC transporter ATP-binding protein [Bacteroidota bacterium]
MNTIIEINNITKSYSSNKHEKNVVLKGVSTSIERSKIVALVGPSGVGKSTLLHIIGTIDEPDSGEIIYNIDNSPKQLSQFKRNELDIFRNRTIGFVFQFHYLLPEFTALENVMLPKLISGSKPSDAKKDAIVLLELTGVADKINNKPMELSGGEQQRIAIARALINKPEIVLADEPTGNLDAKNAMSFINLIKRIQSEFSTTFIIATHSSDIASISDVVLKMKDGQIL